MLSAVRYSRCGGETDASAQAKGGDPERDSVAVMGFAVTNLMMVRGRLSDATVLSPTSKLFDVISGDDVQAMLDQQQQDALSCDQLVSGRAWRRLGCSLHDQRQSE